MAGLHRARQGIQYSQKHLRNARKAEAAGYSKAIAGYSGVADQYSPYMEAGKTSASALKQLFESPEGLTNDPFYKEREKRQLEAVETSAAAKGKLFGGQTLLELMKTGGEFASAEFDKATQRYVAGANIGLAGTQGYGEAKALEGEMNVGKGQAIARSHEQLAGIGSAKAQWGAGMFSSWFGGSGPFGQATAGGLGKG